jgi:hypothetical protein
MTSSGPMLVKVPPGPARQGVQPPPSAAPNPTVHISLDNPATHRFTVQPLSSRDHLGQLVGIAHSQRCSAIIRITCSRTAASIAGRDAARCRRGIGSRQFRPGVSSSEHAEIKALTAPGAPAF